MSRTTRALVATLGLAACLTSAASASEASVHLQIKADRPGKATLRLTATGSGDAQTVPIQVPGEVTLELEGDGPHRLAFDSRLGWCPPRPVEPGDEVVCWLAPYVPVTWRVPNLSEVDMADAPVAVRFSLPQPPDEEAISPAKYPAECTVSADRIRCQVPMGPRTLALSVPGFAPVVWPEVWLDPKDSNELAVVSLRRGGTVVGWLEGAVTGRELAVRVESLEPQNVEATADATPTAMELQPEGSRFVVMGVASGRSRLQVMAAGRPIHTTMPFQVREGEITRLDAVALPVPARLTVVVDPPVRPDGQPWRMRLSRAEDASRGIGVDPITVVTGTAGPDGIWESPALASGLYSLELRGDNGLTWWSDPMVEVEGESMIAVELDLLAIEGQVLFGGEGIPAEVILGSDPERPEKPPARAMNSAVSIQFQTDAEGRFTGWLPFAGQWNAAVVPQGARDSPESGDPVLVDPLEIDTATDDEPIQVEIVLPDTLIAGRVVDRHGRAAEATVHLYERDDSDLAYGWHTRPDGHFQAAMIQPGEYFLRAGDLVGRRSRDQPVKLAEGEKVTGVTLTLGSVVKVEGVTLRGGAPLGGVQLRFRSYGVPTLSNQPVTTPIPVGGDGRFVVGLPVGRTGVVAVAPDGALALSSFQAREEMEPLQIRIPVETGSLVLDFAAWLGGEEKRSAPGIQLRANGAQFWVTLQGGLTGELRGLQEGHPRFVFPKVGVGAYELCVLGRETAAVQCERIVVTPNGEAYFEVPVVE